MFLHTLRHQNQHTDTLVATDCVGNTRNIDTALIGVYDIADIKFNHDSYAGRNDKIKLLSKGEEFDANATDSFGNREALRGFFL